MHNSCINSLSFSSDNLMFASAGNDKQLIIYYFSEKNNFNKNLNAEIIKISSKPNLHEGIIKILFLINGIKIFNFNLFKYRMNLWYFYNYILFILFNLFFLSVMHFYKINCYYLLSDNNKFLTFSKLQLIIN